MHFKNITLSLVLLLGLGFTGCVGQQKDDIFQNSDKSLSYSERYQPARIALNAGDFATLKTLMGLNPTVAETEAATKTKAIAEQTDITDEEKATALESRKAEKLLTDEETKAYFVKNSSELSLIERGLLTLNSGDYQRALLYFDAAELKMEQTDAKSKASKTTSRAGKGLFTGLTGMEESKDYFLRGYEKVMIYNYKALCYMLLGDRRAYNVTRKAIDKQQEEWELFKAELAELEKKNKARNSEADGNKATSDNIAKHDSRDSYTKKKAALVPNAYVNPFGDYMDAMILEIDSYDERSLRDNARIAYTKVLENNKDCYTAKQAIADMRKSAPKYKKVVHVLLADGFSPELMQKTAQIKSGDLTATANYTEATPHPSDIFSARVQVGKMTRTMSSLSKMESIILRDDLDRKPFKTLMMALAFTRSALVDAALGGDEGLPFLAAMINKAQRPDTRSWLSLPNQIMAVRLYVPNNAKSLTITTYDEKKKKMSTRNVALAAKGPSVIYAINYGEHLQAVANESSWITK